MKIKQKKFVLSCLNKGQKTLIPEASVAAMITALGAGNFLAGYLSYLGASPAQCAQIAALPQLGCIFQLISPFFFESTKHRKRMIIACCFGFRCLLGISFFIGIVAKSTRTLSVFFTLFIAFALAGFVTPGLNQWYLELSPKQQRGSYFAWKDIFSSLSVSLTSLVLSIVLDHFVMQNQPALGYSMIGTTILVLAFLNLILMLSMPEISCSSVDHVPVKNLIVPFTNRHYRPIIFLLSFWYFCFNFSSPFLSVYQLEVLGLSHSFISSVGIAAAFLGIAGTWTWGKIADKTNWKTVIIGTGLLLALCNIGWTCSPHSNIHFFAAVFMIITAACNASFITASLNLQYDACSGKAQKSIYLGVTSAVSFMSGYVAVLLGSFLQSKLVTLCGESSISILFLCSSFGMLFTLIYAYKKLP